MDGAPAALPTCASRDACSEPGFDGERDWVAFIRDGWTSWQEAMAQGTVSDWVERMCTDSITLSDHFRPGQPAVARGMTGVCQYYNKMLCRLWGEGCRVTWRSMGFHKLDGTELTVVADHEITVVSPRGASCQTSRQQHHYTVDPECCRISDVHFLPCPSAGAESPRQPDSAAPPPTEAAGLAESLAAFSAQMQSQFTAERPVSPGELDLSPANSDTGACSTTVKSDDPPQLCSAPQLSRSVSEPPGELGRVSPVPPAASQRSSARPPAASTPSATVGSGTAPGHPQPTAPRWPAQQMVPGFPMMPYYGPRMLPPGHQAQWFPYAPWAMAAMQARTNAAAAMAAAHQIAGRGSQGPSAATRHPQQHQRGERAQRGCGAARGKGHAVHSAGPGQHAAQARTVPQVIPPSMMPTPPQPRQELGEATISICGQKHKVRPVAPTESAAAPSAPAPAAGGPSPALEMSLTPPPAAGPPSADAGPQPPPASSPLQQQGAPADSPGAPAPGQMSAGFDAADVAFIRDGWERWQQAMDDGTVAEWVDDYCSDDITLWDYFRPHGEEKPVAVGKEMACAYYNKMLQGVWGEGCFVTWRPHSFDRVSGPGGGVVGDYDITVVSPRHGTFTSRQLYMYRINSAHLIYEVIIQRPAAERIPQPPPVSTRAPSAPQGESLDLWDDGDACGGQGAAHRPAPPCRHNSWDNVRIKRGWLILRCRVCHEQWRIRPQDAERCADFAPREGVPVGCARGASCPQLHIHYVKHTKVERDLARRRREQGEPVDDEGSGACVAARSTMAALTRQP
eukprot:TRINITY_DN19577_c1_g1_i1.p1 TRINITY_DN19577_c1_g1~~TRINITY_DN19577_c1_g1_i1.p1  ORF type:complete len:829 (+),score=198.61 TRINITY_DN19577_c1_g1_i1:106-2487(+)